MTAGQQLRRIRESLGLTIRQVEEASSAIAVRRRNNEYTLPISRLSDIETKDIVPSIYKIYSLAVIYRMQYAEVLQLYGIDLDRLHEDQGAGRPSRTHRISGAEAMGSASIPVRLDPGFDLRTTTNMARMVEQWGEVPFAFLRQHARANYIYGYVGIADLTMYPLIMPGSFLQVDESRNKVEEGIWSSEYQRPIYFLETRDEFICAWCVVQKDQLIIQPHPLSPVSPRIFKYPTEADVVGQVVGIAMQLPSWRQPGPERR